jgi:hypothetical protein
MPGSQSLPLSSRGQLCFWLCRCSGTSAPEQASITARAGAWLIQPFSNWARESRQCVVRFGFGDGELKDVFGQTRGDGPHLLLLRVTCFRARPA